MKVHSHRKSITKRTLINHEGNLNVCQDFKKLAKKSGINYDIDTFQKAFGFTSSEIVRLSSTVFGDNAYLFLLCLGLISDEVKPKAF